MTLTHPRLSGRNDIGSERTRLEIVATEAWRWWIGELAACVPSALRHRLTRSRGRFLLIADATGDNLIEETADGRRPLGRIDVDAPSDGQIVTHTPRARPGELRPVTIRLDARHALRTIASLPLAAERNLAQVIGFEFERLVPFRQCDVYSAYRVTARDKTAQTIAVELTVVPHAELAGVIAALLHLGFRAAEIQVAGTATEASATIALANEKGEMLSRTARRVNLGLGIIAIFLATACLALPLWQGRATINSLDAQIAESRHQAEASAALQKQIDAESQDQRFLTDRKNASPTMTELLATLTQLLPDDTYLTELEMKGDLVRMVGLTGSATALLGAIVKSPSFRDASFESSITHDAKTNRERFEIGAHIARRDKS